MGELLDRDLSEEEIVAEVNADYAEKYGFADVEDYTFKAEKGLNEEKNSRYVADERRARMDARHSS